MDVIERLAARSKIHDSVAIGFEVERPLRVWMVEAEDMTNLMSDCGLSTNEQPHQGGRDVRRSGTLTERQQKRTQSNGNYILHEHQHPEPSTSHPHTQSSQVCKHTP